MYKHILLPIDGSDFGQGSIAYAIRLAKSLDAKLSVLHVTAPYRDIAIGEVASLLPESEYKTRTTAFAAEVLAKAKDAAATAGLAVSVQTVSHSHPWEAIIQTAKEQGADLIVMASHGRRGLAGILIGSETKKVLTHSTIPVLVWRA
jgi:nucleotide-binding universal stress UspA family protein